MKWLSILIFVTPLYFTKTNVFSNNSVAYFGTSTINASQHKDSLTWIEDFKLFRTAVYSNDMATVKKYFKFPLLNAANEIWYLVLTEKEYKKRGITGNKGIVAFKEEDLVKYYKKIFTEPFVKSLLKVKSEELCKKNTFETPEQYESDYTKYKMYASYDGETGILSFNLAYNTVLKDKKGNVEDAGESNVIYNFTVEKDGHIFFKEIRLAG